MSKSRIAELQRWYLQQCDGEWEHSYGIKIDTLDNPGWALRIDVTGTALAGRGFERVEEHRSESDWIVCWVADERFEAAGGPSNLDELCARFLSWAAAA